MPMSAAGPSTGPRHCCSVSSFACARHRCIRRSIPCLSRAEARRTSGGVNQAPGAYGFSPTPRLISINAGLSCPWFPGTRVQQARPGKSRMSPAKTHEFEAGPTVLIVDDDEAVRSSLEMLLEAYGYQVMLARDGRQGLSAFRANSPDVVLMDLMMPIQDGLETIALIRREWPKA